MSSKWATVAAVALDWSRRDSGVLLRDAIVLVPFASLLAPARQAFARAGGWLSRIETTQTLAAALGPAAPAEPGQLRLDTTLDALAATQLLRSRPWGAEWARRDSRGFDRAAADVAATAASLVRAAAAQRPDERPAHWTAARALLAARTGPGASERLLARVALEWAAVAPAMPTDRLFDLRPAAWIVVQVGGADPLVERLCAHAANAPDSPVPCFVVDLDADEAEPFEGIDAASPPAFALCDGFESEAQCTAAQVLDHLRAGEAPVALIAQDRVLVRRVRALLERHGVPVIDETGWRLSTTRAAAQIVGLLNAARADASTDDVLDWLKSSSGWALTRSGRARIAALESVCRRRQVHRAAAIAGAPLDAATAAWWADVGALLAAFGRPARQPLGAWLQSLAVALRAAGTWDALRADDAGRQVIDALRLDRPDAHAVANGAHGAARGEMARSGSDPDAAWAEVPLAPERFGAWLRSVLEASQFVPSAVGPGGAQVVITPLAHAPMRPFAAVVFPGADDAHLGGPVSPHPLLGFKEAAALGLPDASRQRRAELLAFVHLLAVPRVTLLRRRLDGTEPLADSPLVERLALALARRGQTLASWRDVRRTLVRPATPTEPSAPAAPHLLPARLSASALEAMRACPYRFFALHMLKLGEADELDGEFEKRDFGNWLHRVLHRFHAERAAAADPLQEIATLHRVALETRLEHGIDAADFLPFDASFERFAPRYIEWLQQRDQAGARWLGGEAALDMALDVAGDAAFDAAAPDREAVRLHGIIDRVDRTASPDGGAIELIDYKTGSATDLRARVAEPLEDTQLAFYAALMRAEDAAPLGGASPHAAPLRAFYLALDGTRGIEAIEHRDVEASATALLRGVAGDIGRLQAGAGLPALGTGDACRHCAARGICRRDHWSAQDVAPAA